MNLLRSSALVLGFSSLMACGKESHSPAKITTNLPAPVVPGSSEESNLKRLDTLLGTFHEGKLALNGQAPREASTQIDLQTESESKPSRLNSGYVVSACIPHVEAAKFVAQPAPAAGNIPDSLKTDIEEIGSWTGDTKVFSGRIYLKKRYKSLGDTGIYRVDVLIADQGNSKCMLWNYTLSPDKGVSAGFIEKSSEYLAMKGSLDSAWNALGLESDN